MTSTLSVIILAGGTAARLGGISKADIPVAGRSLLAWTLSAVRTIDATAQMIVVAPDSVAVPAGISQTMEEPPHGGPLAGVAAGTRLAQGNLVLIATCDAPLSPLLFPDLLRALTSPPGQDAAVPVRRGRANFLNALYRAEALRAVLETGPAHNTPVRRVLSTLSHREVPDDQDHSYDIDEWADVATLADRLTARSRARR